MATYHGKIGAALRKLARNGLVTAADFGSILGVPKRIELMLDGAAPERSLCA